MTVGTATSWRDVPYAVLDLETTGLDPKRDEIVSYGVVPIDDGCIRIADVRQGLVKPARPLPASSIRIHGIRPRDIADAPSLDEALDDLIDALADRVVVVHVDWVERGFLGRALKRRGLRLPEPVLDTNRLARAWLPRCPETVALSPLARKLGLPVYSEHQAVGDALTTAQVFVALATLHQSTFGELCALGCAPPRRFGRR